MGVLEFLQKHYLAVGSLCVGGILECIKIFFKRVNFAAPPVLHLPDYAVGSAANFL